MFEGWKVCFDILWPHYGSKLKAVEENIEKHKWLLKDEITLADISEAHNIRSKALEEIELNRKHREKQEFEALRSSLDPRLYDAELEAICGSLCEGTNNWPLHEKVIRNWLEEDESKSPLVWLTAIPGAGK